MAATGIKISEIGLPNSLLQINKTTRLINMAFEMMKFIENVTYDKNEKILIKIGIHIGKVIAGVIGYHKPQFSLIGDTINTTSRICSTGDPSTITISEEAMLESRSCDLHFTKKIVAAKGKGDLVTYQVRKKGANDNIFRSLVMKNIINVKIEVKSNIKKSFFCVADNERNNMMMKVANVFQTTNNNNIIFSGVENKEGAGIGSKETSKNDDDGLLDKNGKLKKHKEQLIEWKSFEEKLENEEGYDEKTDNYKTMIASKYLLRIQNIQLFEDFIYKMNRDYCKADRVRMLVLCIVYLIRTLFLVSLKKFFEQITLVFFLRGIFVFFTLMTIYFIKRITSLSLRCKIFKTLIMIFYIFGVIATLMEIYYSMIYENSSMSFVEILLIYLVHSNLL